MNTNQKVKIELTNDEALVFYEWLASNHKKPENFKGIVEKDSAEERVLWDIECILETVLVAPFKENYDELVEQSRKRVLGE